MQVWGFREEQLLRKEGIQFLREGSEPHLALMPLAGVGGSWGVASWPTLSSEPSSDRVTWELRAKPGSRARIRVRVRVSVFLPVLPTTVMGGPKPGLAEGKVQNCSRSGQVLRGEADLGALGEGSGVTGRSSPLLWEATMGRAI